MEPSTYRKNYNLNISTFNDYTTDLDESVDKLRGFNCQNVSELLNQPRPSLLEALRGNFSEREQLSTEMNVPKLPSIDEPTGSESHRSNLGGQIDRSIQALYHEDYKNYLRRIKKPFSTFKLNHYSKYSEKVRGLSQMKQSCSYYNPTTKLNQLGLSKDFFKLPAEFVIDKSLLENKKEDLQLIVKSYDKKFEVIEIEMGKILSQSKRISNYIDENLCLEISINKYCKKFERNKKELPTFKGRILNNSARIMLKSSKKENLSKLLENAKKLLKMTESIKRLSDSQGDCKEESDLIEEIRQIMKNDQDQLHVFALIEKELLSFEQKNNEKVMEEFLNCVKSYWNSSFPDLEETVKNCLELGEKVSDLKSFTIEDELPSKMITIHKLISNEQLSQICLIIFKISDEMLNELFRRIDKYVKNVNFRVANQLQKGLRLITKCFITYLDDFDFLKKINNINKESETETKLKERMNNYMKEFISKGCTECSNYTQTDDYMLLRQDIMNILKEYGNKFDINCSNLLVKVDEEFVLHFYSNKHEEVQHLIENEDWNVLTSIPFKYQQMCDMITSFNFDNINNQKKTQVCISELNDVNRNPSFSSSMMNVPIIINNSIINNSILNNTIIKNSIINNSLINGNVIISEGDLCLLNLKGNKLKTSKSFLSIINLLFETIKLLLNFHSSLQENILNLIAKSLNIYIVTGKNLVLEGDGTIKGKSITEKEIALLNSNFNMLRTMMLSFTNVHNNNIVRDVINGIMTSLDKSIGNCTEAIAQLVSEIIKESTEELRKLDFKNFPTFTEKDYNTYIKKFSKCKKLYDNLINCFDERSIIQIFKSNFDVYFDQMEKIVLTKPKIESDSMLKQFRTEMIYVKKILKLYDLCETTGFIEAVDRISKAANPNKVLKKKKNKDSEPKEEV